MKNKRILAILLVVCLLFVMNGCGVDSSQEKKGAYTIFYISTEEDSLVPVDYDLTSTDPEEQVAELLEQFRVVEDNLEYHSALPKDIEVERYKLENSQLCVYFSEMYSTLDVISEVLLRAALVRTMVQIQGVDCVSFYVEDAPLMDSKGNIVGVMTADSFVENLGEQINTIETKNITRYFASPDGTSLVAENQQVYASSNVSVEKLAMQHLMLGPTTQGLIATIPAGSKLISVSTLDGVCFVNFDDGFLKQNYDISEEVVIYSIVNTLSELSTVNKVQISVNGDTSMVYRENCSFSTLYERNLDYVKTLQEVGVGGDE